VLRFCLFMFNMFPAVSAVLFESEFFRSSLFILCGRIIFIFTACTL